MARCDDLRPALAGTSEPPAADVASLSPRELDVLRLAGAGRTNKEIGAELYLSEHTVRNYLSSVFAKLGVSRRSEVAALAARLRL
jgi:DNA-binding CsgD family transcriptional regulator